MRGRSTSRNPKPETRQQSSGEDEDEEDEEDEEDKGEIDRRAGDSSYSCPERLGGLRNPKPFIQPLHPTPKPEPRQQSSGEDEDEDEEDEEDDGEIERSAGDSDEGMVS